MSAQRPDVADVVAERHKLLEKRLDGADVAIAVVGAVAAAASVGVAILRWRDRLKAEKEERETR